MARVSAVVGGPILRKDNDMNLVFAKHTDGGKNFLFSAPEGTAFTSGEKVSVTTKRGEQHATVSCTNFAVSEEAAKVLAKECGGYFPLASVTGRVTVTVEPFKEDKPAVREVRRPAKVGEWVKVVAATATKDCYENGNIFQVSSLIGYDGDCYCKMPEMKHYNCFVDGCIYLYLNEYVVLEGYAPEKQEEKPKYWSGEVICTDDENTSCFTKGRVYEFKDGFVFQDGGNKYDIRPAHDLAEAETLYGCHVKFIEYKGEQPAKK